MNEHLNVSNSNFNNHLHSKVLNVPVNTDIPLLSNNEDQVHEDIQIVKAKDDLSFFEMVIYSLPAFSKMAALVIFK